MLATFIVSSNMCSNDAICILRQVPVTAESPFVCTFKSMRRTSMEQAEAASHRC